MGVIITFFTVPKPFKGKDSISQQNAIESWKVTNPNCEIFIFGDDEGVEENSLLLGARHFPNVHKTSLGTPLLDTVFSDTREKSSADYLCYLNADIIVLTDLEKVIKRARLKNFLMVSQRWDLDFDRRLNFASGDWCDELIDEVNVRGVRHPPWGSDLFIFPKEKGLRNLPPFVVGRKGWDNWMIGKALEVNIPVVDASRCVILIHQNHDYSHIPQRNKFKWEGPESEINKELMGYSENYMTYFLPKATYILTRYGKIPIIIYQRGCAIAGFVKRGVRNMLLFLKRVIQRLKRIIV